MAQPTSLRIGKESFGYNYTWQQQDLYKCERGSDWCKDGEVLWLFRADDGQWHAVDGKDAT